MDFEPTSRLQNPHGDTCFCVTWSPARARLLGESTGKESQLQRDAEGEPPVTVFKLRGQEAKRAGERDSLSSPVLTLPWPWGPALPLLWALTRQNQSQT